MPGEPPTSNAFEPVIALHGSANDEIVAVWVPNVWNVIESDKTGSRDQPASKRGHSSVEAIGLTSSGGGEGLWVEHELGRSRRVLADLDNVIHLPHKQSQRSQSQP